MSELCILKYVLCAKQQSNFLAAVGKESILKK
jgi:hypothetical protein